MTNTLVLDLLIAALALYTYATYVVDEAPATIAPKPVIRCGDFGGVTAKGQPCGVRMDWSSRCKRHL